MDGDEIRWRPPSILFVPLLLCVGFIFYIDIFQPQMFRTSDIIQHPLPRFTGFQDNTKGFLIKTEGCRIPDMDPFDASVVKYIFKEERVVCNNDTPPLFDSNLSSIFMLNTSLSHYRVNNISALKCCYSEFKRVVPSGKDSDTKVSFSKECVSFNITANITSEYIRVTCSYNSTDIYKDFFSFVPVSITNVSSPEDGHERLNILVVGLDAVSRLNLHRQMPNTVKTLENLSAIEFLGYNKVADNTFPNLVPVLTGLSENELTKKCWKSGKDRFDKCDFLWKHFSDNGYKTVFGEDSAWMGIFNYVKLGFKKQPTDYYWDMFDYTAEHNIGNKHKMNVYQCIGSRLVYNVLLEYINKFVKTMNHNKLPYFSFFWGSSLSHDYLNKPNLGDDDYAHFFTQLSKDGILNDTVLIFMSDHGIRWGDIRSTYQGRMEERLPFLFIVLPQKYRADYPQVYINLKRNTKRLTTPYDLHETLKDLINPFNLTQENLTKRIQKHEKKRGYSLFERVPSNRTCEDAGISTHWCTCQKSIDIDKNNSSVIQATKFTINYINDQLVGYASCANLSLAEIFNARIHSSETHILGDKNFSVDYTIAFKTTPGDAIFEVTVRQHLNKPNNPHFNVMGTISRINLYGKQSLCVTDFHLKLYCYCKT